MWVFKSIYILLLNLHLKLITFTNNQLVRLHFNLTSRDATENHLREILLEIIAKLQRNLTFYRGMLKVKIHKLYNEISS